jgi:dCTP deaminase
VRLERGDRLCQVRVTRGEAGLSREEVLERHAHEPLCFLDDRPLEPEELLVDPEGAVHLRIGLAGREPCGWRAASATAVVAFGRRGAHAAEDFWDPVRTRTGRSGARQCVLEPGDFTIFASRERIRVPADLAAEMLPIDVGVGELRNNYAGFFDSGFGSHGDPARPGTPAVLEVRAHDVPFLVEDGQVFFRLRFFRTTGRPEHLYGEGREGPSYGNQDLTLARAFRPGS